MNTFKYNFFFYFFMFVNHVCPYCNDAYLEVMAFIDDPLYTEAYLLCPVCHEHTYYFELSDELTINSTMR